MTPDNARFMLKQRGYPEGGDWLAHCIRRGQAGNDVGLELALIMMVERDQSVVPFPERRGPGRPRKDAA